MPNRNPRSFLSRAAGFLHGGAGGRGGGIQGGTVEGRTHGMLIVNVGGRRHFIKLPHRRHYGRRRGGLSVAQVERILRAGGHRKGL